MAKMTLLELVQDILSAMDSDEVNSVGDTVESLQVAQNVKNTYYELFGEEVRPSFQGLVKLDGLSDVTQPHIMQLPDNVKQVDWIKYNNADVTFLQPKDFIEFVVARIGQTAITDYTDSNGMSLPIQTNMTPSYWTTFDNNRVYFDSFDSSSESSLQQSKSLCFGQYEQEFLLDDDFIPPLDASQFPGLLAEATSSCFVNHKQVSNSKEEQKSKRQRIKGMNDRWRLNQRKPYNRTPNYGRQRPF